MIGNLLGAVIPAMLNPKLINVLLADIPVLFGGLFESMRTRMDDLFSGIIKAISSMVKDLFSSPFAMLTSLIRNKKKYSY